MNAKVQIPKEAMPVVEILRRDVQRPTARILGPTPRFEGGKCPMGLHPTALGKLPVTSFEHGSELFALVRTGAPDVFSYWWDSLTVEQAYAALDLIWPKEE